VGVDILSSDVWAVISNISSTIYDYYYDKLYKIRLTDISEGKTHAQNAQKRTSSLRYISFLEHDLIKPWLVNTTYVPSKESSQASQNFLNFSVTKILLQ